MKEKSRARAPAPGADEVPALIGSMDYQLAMESLRDGEWRVAGTALFSMSQALRNHAGLMDDSAVCFAIHGQRYGEKRGDVWDRQIISFYTQHRVPAMLERYQRLVDDPAELAASKERMLLKYRDRFPKKT